MTVIATDGRSMACDGRTTATSDEITNDATDKIFRAKDGSVVGCAGEASCCRLLRQWFEDGENMDAIPKYASPPDDEGSGPADALILRPDGRIQFLEYNFAYTERQAPAAIGSGGHIAIGLMLAGLTPEKAVRRTIERISSCGGRVRVLKPAKRRRK